MLKLELKRILKTRSTWWLAAIAFVLCILMAFLIVNAVSYSYLDGGKERTTKGIEAIRARKEMYATLEGNVTPEVFEDTFIVIHALDEQYAGNIPLSEYYKKLYPVLPVLNWARTAFFDEKTGTNVSVFDVSPEQAANYYLERLISLERMLEAKYTQHPQVLEYALPTIDNTKTPYTYTYGIGSSDAIEYLSVCTFFLVLICTLINAPIFSSDYTSGADDIMRCARRGRSRLAFTKLFSALIISLGLFILCTGAFLSITYSVFGFDNTSVELMGVSFNPASLTAMGYLGVVFVSGLLTFLSMMCFTLFLSARIKNSLTVLAISVAIGITPTIMALVLKGGNVESWVRFILPSGGIGLATNMLYELRSLRFLWIGDFVTWSPYVMLAAAAVQIPIWFGLAVRAYNKHEAK